MDELYAPYAPPPAQEEPALCKASEVARAVGIARRLLVQEALAGRLPLRVIKLGPAQTAYVNRADAQAFLQRLRGEGSAT